MDKALEIIARIGSDNPPTLEELESAKVTIARELHALKKAGSSDLEAMVSLKETYAVVETAIAETQAEAEKAGEEVDGILDGIPDPDAEELSVKVEDEPTKVLPLREAVERLGLVQTVQVTEREPEPKGIQHSVRLGSEVRDDATWDDIADAAYESVQSLKSGRERVVRLTTEYPEEFTLSGRKDENTRLIDQFVTPGAVAAAGGCCSLPTPIYDNPVLGSTARPIRDALPSLGAPRGKVAFFESVCIPQEGSGIWTCEDDAAVTEDPLTWKDCTEIECGEEDGAEVEAIYRCLTVGDYTARFASEEWRARLQAAGISHARLAEVTLFSKMRAAVTSTHTGLTTGSVYNNVLSTVGRAGALIRQDQRLEDVQLDFFAGAWLPAAIRADLRARGLRTGRTDIEIVAADLAQAFANENVRVVWSWDIDDIESFQYDGALADWPDTASTVLAPSGFFTFLDGGQFDLGTEIRDFDQARKNQLGAFAESYEGLLARGCNAKALDIPVEVCDDVPCE